MKFKEPFLAEQFTHLDKRLQAIVRVLEVLMSELYRKDLIVTSVLRNDPDSPHYFYRAVDVRSSELLSADRLHLVFLINMIFPYSKSPYQTMLCHDVGQGAHFHVQVKP